MPDNAVLPGPFTAAIITQILDASFRKAESLSPLWLVWEEMFANKLIDGSPLPQAIADQLNAWLAAQKPTPAQQRRLRERARLTVPITTSDVHTALRGPRWKP